MNNKERYIKYEDKIEHIICHIDGNLDEWECENYQRQYLSKGLEGKNITNDDYILLSDCDDYHLKHCILRQDSKTRVQEVLFKRTERTPFC